MSGGKNPPHPRVRLEKDVLDLVMDEEQLLYQE